MEKIFLRQFFYSGKFHTQAEKIFVMLVVVFVTVVLSLVGVGLLTVAMLMKNVVKAVKLQLEK